MLRVGSGRGPFARAAVQSSSAPFDPLTLFASGEKGFLLDPSDPANLFQNSAGTTAVTATGQPVGHAVDLSGNGNHFIQTTDANRVAWQQDGDGFYYLDGNGISQTLSRSVTLPAGLRKATVWIAFLADSVGLQTTLLHSGAIDGGRWQIKYAGSGSSTTAPTGRLSNGDNRIGPANAISVSTKYILTVEFDNTTQEVGVCVRARINGVSQVMSQLALNTITDILSGTNRLFGLGATSEELDGRIYGACVRYAESTTQEVENMEAWMAARCGVTL